MIKGAGERKTHQGRIYHARVARSIHFVNKISLSIIYDMNSNLF